MGSWDISLLLAAQAPKHRRHMSDQDSRSMGWFAPDICEADARARLVISAIGTDLHAPTRRVQRHPPPVPPRHRD
jgi:hypothetical protein